MKSILVYFVAMAIALMLADRGIPIAASQTPEPQEILINELYTEENSLSYNGYDVVKVKRHLKFGFRELTYAIVKRNSRIKAKFDSIEPGLPNATDFGLFPFLGRKTKQLAISQTVPRGGRHWVVDLSSPLQILFDSGDYEVGREDLAVVDLDHDGVYEISLPVTAFYLEFNQLPISSTPLPQVIFKYDGRIGKYLPANHLYRDYYLNGIETQIKTLTHEDGAEYLARRLVILLRYLYAGKEKDGWAFFDEKYTLLDKAKIKAKVKSVINKAPAYRFISRRTAT